MLCHPWPDHTLAVDGLTCWQCRIGKGVWLSHRHMGIKRHFNLLPPLLATSASLPPIKHNGPDRCKKGKNNTQCFNLKSFTLTLTWDVHSLAGVVYGTSFTQHLQFTTLANDTLQLQDGLHPQEGSVYNALLLSHHCCLTAHCKKACFQWAMNCGQQFKIGFVVQCCAALFFTLSIQDGFTVSQQDVVK